ncbi:MAG: exo-alpha-sialidase [Phycisphaerae bacterium]|jgi:sialidase-1|nr:exo-alpha-sialidase [Phycisphaerae bacterium]
MTKKYSSFSAGALTLACLVSSLACAAKPAEGPLQDFLGKPRMEIQQLFDRERHPNVVVTLKGTVLATLGNKSLRARRSEDGGKTWGKETIIAKPGWQGGGMIVDEVNGNIFAFAEDRHPPAPLSVYRSSDDGKTWRKVEVKIHPDTNGNVPSMHMNEHGITLRRGKHAGRLIRAARHYGKANYPRKHWPTHYTTAIYSDDHGKTWKTSKPFAEMGTGEATIAELSDGTLYYNSRSHWNAKKPPKRRRCAWSTDGGETWTGWKIVQILPDGPQNTAYGCFGGLVRLPIKGRDILLYSNCDSPARRNHGTVWASFDGGKTWPLKRLVRKGSFEYSSLAAGRPGTPSEGWIYMHFEGLVPKDSHVARFNLSWLMGGKPTGDGTIPRIETRTDASQKLKGNEAYIFTSFRGNGEDGLHLAYSRDGLKWTALKGDKSFLKPRVGGKLMRDPCIIQGPDKMFHMVWTSSWRDKGIGIAHSKDLINWTEQKFVGVMKHEATARNCWAPEITWDPDSK